MPALEISLLDSIRNKKKKGNTGPPGPTAQENELIALQVDALRRSNLTLQDLKKFTLEGLGLRYNSQGVLERMPISETQDPYLANFKEAQKQRLLGTYTSPQMEQSLLNERMKLPANVDSTIGRQATDEYVKNEGILREGINRGGLDSGANLISQREGLLSNLKARGSENYANMNASDMKLISGIGAALSPYQILRDTQLQSSMNSEAIKSQRKAQNMQMAGTAVGAIISVVAIAV